MNKCRRPGFRFEIVPMTYGKFRLIETDGKSVERAW